MSNPDSLKGKRLMSFQLIQDKVTGELVVNVEDRQYRNVTLSSFLRVRRLRFFAHFHRTGREGRRWVITWISL